MLQMAMFLLYDSLCSDSPFKFVTMSCWLLELAVYLRQQTSLAVNCQLRQTWPQPLCQPLGS